MPEPPAETRSGSLAGQVAWLVATEKIRTVIARYARASDAFNDPQQMRRLFTADAVWEAVGSGPAEKA